MNESSVDDTCHFCKLRSSSTIALLTTMVPLLEEESQFDRQIDFKPDEEKSENCLAWNVLTRQALAMMDGHRMGPSLADLYIDGLKISCSNGGQFLDLA